jgi:competence protein ComEC
VLDVRLGAVSIVLTGDISGAVEESLVARLRPADVRALKVSHHGSATSTSAAFVAALRPRVAVVSCGRENRFGHPAPVVIDRLKAAGSAIYRTDRHGAITLETDGKTVYEKTAMQGSVWSELSRQHDATTTRRHDNTTTRRHDDTTNSFCTRSLCLWR